MACYKARGFLQKAESLGLTAFGLGQRMIGLRVRQSEAQYLLHKLSFKARRSGRASSYASPAPTPTANANDIPSGTISENRSVP